MKKIILARHAKSSWEEIGISDFDRPLNKRGLHDAPRMAEYLKENLVFPDMILSSPANRALTTAQYYEKELLAGNRVQTVSSIYEASEKEILNIIHQTPDEIEALMLVGHNPTFTMLANTLANEMIVNIPTCGVVSIDLNVKHWQDVKPGVGVLERFDFPKNIDQ